MINQLTLIGKPIQKDRSIRYFLEASQELLQNIKTSFCAEAFFHAYEQICQVQEHLDWISRRTFTPKSSDIYKLIQHSVFPMIRCIKRAILSQDTPLHVNSFFLEINILGLPWHIDYISLPTPAKGVDFEPLTFNLSEIKMNQ